MPKALSLKRFAEEFDATKIKETSLEWRAVLTLVTTPAEDWGASPASVEAALDEEPSGGELVPTQPPQPEGKVVALPSVDKEGDEGDIPWGEAPSDPLAKLKALGSNLAHVDFNVLLDPRRPKPPAVVSYNQHTLAIKGEVIRVAGDPGVGKSFLLWELSLAAGTGRKVAGLTVEADRVMWVDEEGDDDILAERSILLQAQEDAMGVTMRYYLNQDIRLDRPEVRQDLFNRVEDFKPDILVIDSATRISSADENAAGEQARLYNDGIKPLSRRFGCTVFIIDHTVKSEYAKGDRSIRGSGEKSAQVDRNWLLKRIDDDSFRLEHGKTRRGRVPVSLILRRHLEGNALRHVCDGVV